MVRRYAGMAVRQIFRKFFNKQGTISNLFAIFAFRMDSTIFEEDEITFETFDEEDGSVLIAAESPWRGFAIELQDLHYLKGASFINQLKLIINSGEFFPVEGEHGIFSAIGNQSDDYDNLINAARKAAEHGYRVYILPNPRSFRTADFIFEKKGVLGLYDLKTVYGKSSVETQLLDSIGQTNRVLLNLLTDYNTRLLASDIKKYFETNPDAVEVLIFKGHKFFSVERTLTLSVQYHRIFRKRYEK